MCMCMASNTFTPRMLSCEFTNYIENVCVRVHNVYNFLYTKILNFDPLFDNFRQLASLFALKSFQKDLCRGMHEMEKNVPPKTDPKIEHTAVIDRKE